MRDPALRHPLIIAHRGYRARYPENTLCAFRAARDAGAHMIELDVTLTRDRRVVVIHDATLDRTTDGTGPVRDRTLEELRRLDAGAWFSRAFAGERLPALEEVLDLAHRPPLVNIEIKPEAFEPEAPPDAIERRVVDAVRSRGLLERVLVSSFEWRVLAAIARMASPPALGLLSEDPLPPDGIDTCRELGAFSWHCHHRKLDRGQVDRLHEAGIRVYPYTVNDPARIGRLLDMGVDGVFTDDPPAMAALLAHRGQG